MARTFICTLARNLVRTSTLAALALAAALLLSSSVPAFAWDNYGGEAEHRAFDNGYADGLHHGRYDRGEGFRYNIHSQQYNDARDGYAPWMGSFGHYKHAYRAGYEEGYRRGFDTTAFRRDWEHEHQGWR